MILQKYFTTVVNGVFDPYLLFHRFSKLYDNVKYYNPVNDTFIGAPNSIVIHPLDGIKIENVFNCIILEGIDNVNSKIKFSINLNIFSERCIILEVIFDVDDYKTMKILIDKFDDIDENALKIEQDGKIKESSFSGIISDFMLNKLMRFNDKEFRDLLDEYDPTADALSTEIILNKGKEINSFEPDTTGESGGYSVNNGFNSFFIIQDIEKKYVIDEAWKKISDEKGIYQSDYHSSYLIDSNNEYKKFKEDYKRFVIYKTILGSYNLVFNSWYHNIKLESTDLIKNLDNDNDTFWKELRLKIEKWQLNFLKQDAHRSWVMNRIDKLHNYKSTDGHIKADWIRMVDKAKSTMHRQIEDIKYQLVNIATPGHTHDEQSLQIETEKTNERILLLSFLALSIPMLNAILSPDFTLYTKTVSFIILLSLPLLYFSTIRFTKMRRKKINRKRNLIRKKGNLLKSLESDVFELKQVNNDNKMSQDTKNVAIDLLNLNIDVKEKFLKKIEKKI